MLKALLRSGYGTLAAAIFLTVGQKILAITIGIDGVGTFSVLRQFLVSFGLLATISGQQALIQGLACRDGESRALYYQTAAGLILRTSVAVAFCVLVFGPLFGQMAFAGKVGSTTQYYLVTSLAAPTLLYGIYVVGISTLNGQHDYPGFATSQGLMGLGFALGAVPGGLLFSRYPISICLPLVASYLLPSIYAKWRLEAGSLKIGLVQLIRSKPDPELKALFLKVARTMLLTAFMGSAVQSVVKSFVFRGIGKAGAGTYEASWQFSQLLVTLCTGAFAAYYIPRLSAITNDEEKLALMYRTFRYMAIVAGAGASSLIALKHVGLDLLYSPQFKNAASLMQFMLIGDFLKCCGWVFGVTTLAFPDMRTYLRSELLLNGCLALGSIVGVLEGNLQILAIGYLVSYLVYFTYCSWYGSTRHRVNLRGLLGQFSLSLVIVTATALLTFVWCQHLVAVAVALVAVASLFVLNLTNSERVQVGRLLHINKR